MIKNLNKKVFRDWTLFECSAILVLAVLSVMMRMIFLDLKFPDYTICLEPWTAQLKEYGGFKGLAYEIGNYTPAYMHFLMIFSYFDIEPLYLIKALSIIFDFILAFSFITLLSKQLNKQQKVMSFFGVLWLPTVITNSGVWGSVMQFTSLLYCWHLPVYSAISACRFVSEENKFVVWKRKIL